MSSGKTYSEQVDISDNKVIIPEEFVKYFYSHDLTYQLLIELPKKYKPSEVIEANSDGQEVWQAVGQHLMKNNRYFEAIQIFYGLYEHMLKYQEENKKWTHKGMPLVWISDCYKNLNYIYHWKKYLMMTLCEDTIREKGKITPNLSGVYFRLAWFAMTEKEINNYAKEIFKIFKKDKIKGNYPEHIIQKIDNRWINIPNTIEANHFIITKHYLSFLFKDIDNDSDGKILETIADYLLSSMPGCKTNTRQISHSTDYDVVCSMEGFQTDFRSEFGRYFICEAKNWGKPADFTSFAKFCRVLDSTKMNFGILFSKKGISGEKVTKDEKDAKREQLKVFQDRGILIIVINKKDIQSIIKGENFVEILRDKYENVRLDLERRI